MGGSINFAHQGFFFQRQNKSYFMLLKATPTPLGESFQSEQLHLIRCVNPIAFLVYVSAKLPCCISGTQPSSCSPIPKSVCYNDIMRKQRLLKNTEIWRGGEVEMAGGERPWKGKRQRLKGGSFQTGTPAVMHAHVLTHKCEHTPLSHHEASLRQSALCPSLAMSPLPQGPKTDTGIIGLNTPTVHWEWLGLDKWCVYMCVCVVLTL